MQIVVLVVLVLYCLYLHLQYHMYHLVNLQLNLLHYCNIVFCHAVIQCLTLTILQSSQLYVEQLIIAQTTVVL